MKSRRAPVRDRGGLVVVGWILAGASVATSTAAVAMSAVALRRSAQSDAGARGVASEPTDYTRVRISAVGDGPRVPRVPPLHAVAPVPPENPHAPPTPPVGNPVVGR
ncbi:hypothetical protein [Mycetocola sp. 2940]|uniref:hypothetical protein n=1 Tax=Mycetocola sp. 2940 TaxID=3156452 RepID=UPI0033932557